MYRKRFHKKCETELTVLAPRREQLTGDEAHDRVRAMLAETVDTDLWQAQRVLQSASTAAVDLSGCDALSRALDVAAGDAAALSGTEPLLIERIDAEYRRYFTPTGRPTGEWAAAINRARATPTPRCAECAAAVAEVDDRVHRHAVLTQQWPSCRSGESPQGGGLPRQAAADAIAAHRAGARSRADRRRSGCHRRGGDAAHTARRRLLTEIDSRRPVAALEDEARKPPKPKRRHGRGRRGRRRVDQPRGPCRPAAPPKPRGAPSTNSQTAKRPTG